ncbi:hypothetical protein ACHHYP_11364 [Achlya hypogyna]|uniref:RRM domain-containing protein n=1 Tax=Achlya hypogyna TaxID=1202772 RepID=A0A1V9YJ91_ACHHY|nr:hypothetical protein ACHHYP_11364 [Achlya hypogyna]
MEASKKRKLGYGEPADPRGPEDANELTRLLEPFSRDQIVTILVSAAMQHDSIFNEIKTMASADIAHRKIFVRGLAWEATSDKLRQHFVRFGPVQNATVIMDKVTGKSKGFGFVTFDDMESANAALKAQPHDIDGRKCPCNLAAAQDSSATSRHKQSSYTAPHAAPPAATHNAPYPAPHSGSHAQQTAAPVPSNAPPTASDSGPPGDEADRKLFVRGLHWDTQADAVTAEFQKYGDIEDVAITKDRQTGKSKGYGFIVYRHQMAAKRALAQPMKIIDGRNTHCNLASQPQRGNGNHPPPPAAPYHAPMHPAYPPPHAGMYMVPQSYGVPPYADPNGYPTPYPQPPMPTYGYAPPRPPMPHPPPPRQ